MSLSPNASASHWQQTNLLRIVLLLTISSCLAFASGTANAQDDNDPMVEDPTVEEPPMEEEEFLLDDEGFAPVDDFAGSAPQMVGDFGGGSMFFTLGGFPGFDAVQAPIAIAGGSRRIKIAENNQVIPLNRVYATYNHFHNAFVVTERSGFDGGGGAAAGPYTGYQSESIDQFTVGVEKSFGCGRYSVEFRMPFTGGLGVDFASAATGSTFDSSTQSIGNLAINLKALVYDSCNLRAAVGCGINTPTGSDVSILSIDPNALYAYDLVVHNDSLHFLPWAGFYATPRERLWLQGFAQLDVAANGNRVTGTAFDGLDLLAEPVSGVITEQTLLYLDLQAGYWLYQDCCPCATGLTALAAMVELHYTTALNNADYMVLPFGAGAIGNPGASTPGFVNRFDVVNLTAGLRFEISNTWKINAAAVVPLESGHVNAGGRVLNRFFDAEAVLQVNREF